MTTAEREDPTAPSLRLHSEADLEDCRTLLGRLVRLDAGPVRLQVTTVGATIWARPLGVLLRRDLRAHLSVPDRTVDAGELLARLGSGPEVVLPDARDVDWHATLPPGVGWRLLDSVPTSALHGLLEQATRLVRAAADPAAAGDSLLQRDAVTVSDEHDEVTVGMREVAVLYRLGLLTASTPDELVRVSATGSWTRVAARHGTVYQRRGSALGLS
ncbi:MAG: hypothetical protein H0T85_00990 [Geodermatophilaceae bacterium]|nr:hypothetical protein [Geodermatophilaceae bacterium]